MSTDYTFDLLSHLILGHSWNNIRSDKKKRFLKEKKTAKGLKSFHHSITHSLKSQPIINMHSFKLRNTNASTIAIA